jgi:hypothetical protein
MRLFTGRGSRGHDKYRNFNNGNTPLNNEQLRSVAPSIFAGQAMPGVSAAYKFLPTIQVVEGLRKEGWEPVWVSEQQVRLESRLGFQKHMIRFQHRDLIQHESEYRPEVVLINSHDRSSAYQVHAGIFRLVCGNGMIVSDSTFERVSIRHAGFEPAKLIEASFRVLGSIPLLAENVETFKARRLSAAESKAFAEGAILLKYDDLSLAPIGAEALLEARRSDDNGADLWSTFNRVQENLIRGGLKDRTRRKENGRLHPRSRAVSGLDENVRLNKALWHLAEALKTHAFAA